MPRSLFTAVSGLASNQQRMDVIADNIANVNTVGFKKSRMEFSDSFTQTLRQPSDRAPVGIQIGSGSQVSTVSGSFVQGAFQRTDIQTDIAISGEGFFVVQDIAGNNLFTRDGAFTIDKDGFVINALGYKLRGVIYTPNPAGDIAAVDPGNGAPAAIGDVTIPNSFVSAGPPAATTAVVSYGIDTDGKLTLLGANGSTLVAAFITTAKFSNPQALEKKGNSLYGFNSAAGDFDGTGSFSETDDVRKGGTNGFGIIQSGALELSNVDLAEQFSEMIVTQRGFDANAKVITTADEMLQTLNTLKR